MGDRSGSIRWWDVTTGLSSSFRTHREGIRRIKFSPVVHGDRSRGRIAVLFYDNTFSIFDLVSTNKCYHHVISGLFWISKIVLPYGSCLVSFILSVKNIYVAIPCCNFDSGIGSYVGLS
jgi:WD40 repeat protein